jgi:hypothetical protein
VSNFIEKYYGENLPSVHNPPPRYNTGEDESNLSLFQGQLGSASASTTKTLTHEEWRCIMLYVLHNLEEVAPYMGQVLNELVSIRRHYSSSNPLFHIGTGNFFITSGINRGILHRRKLIPSFQRVRDRADPISFLGSKTRYFPI